MSGLHGGSQDPRERPSDEMQRQLDMVRSQAPLVWDSYARSLIELRHTLEERHRNRVTALLAASVFAGALVAGLVGFWAGWI